MASYRDALRNRLTQIDEMGAAQTTWEKIQAQRKAAQRRWQEAYDLQNAAGQSAAIGRNNINGMQLSPIYSGSTKGVTNGSSDFNRFMARIAGQESGGNYGAVNRKSGALGKYQIMPGNIAGVHRGWDWEALHRDVSNSQFLSSPQIQEQIARYKLQQYFNKYGPAGASIAWYAGPGAANRYASSGSVSRTAQGAYPSVYSYMQSIMRGL